MNLRVILPLCAVLAAGFIVVSMETATEEAPATEMKSAYPVMSRPELTTLGMLIQEAGLVEFFQGTGPFTVFAPSNSAFEKMDPAMLAKLQLPENRDKLIAFINYHVVMGAYPSSNLKSKSYRTVNGRDVEVKNENGKITVNGANVVQADLTGPNGVGYIIDTVLAP